MGVFILIGFLSVGALFLFASQDEAITRLEEEVSLLKLSRDNLRERADVLASTLYKIERSPRTIEERYKALKENN